jgi:probable HAF family extracellular repeat protein
VANKYAFQTIAVPGAGGNVSVAGINDFGELSGSYEVGSPGDPYPQAFTKIGSTITTYAADGAPYGQHATGGAVNNLGQVVGSSGHYQQTARGYLYAGGSFTRIEGPGDAYFTSAYGLNDRGQVVGNMAPAYTSGAPVAYVWQSGSIAQTFAYPGSTVTVAAGINDLGQIVGHYSDGSTNHGFLAANGSLTAIDAPGAQSTQAEAINNKGEIVGTYFDGTHYHGFTDQGGQMTFIDAPGATDTWVHGVNDFGQIVGAFRVNDTSVTEGFAAMPGAGRNLTADFALMLPRQVAKLVGAATGHAYVDPSMTPLVIPVGHG